MKNLTAEDFIYLFQQKVHFYTQDEVTSLFSIGSKFMIIETDSKAQKGYLFDFECSLLR